jgi:hypothetical protein
MRVPEVVPPRLAIRRLFTANWWDENAAASETLTHAEDMTEPHETDREPTAAAGGRWAEPRSSRRLFRLAALVVIVAGIVFIFAVVFWTGLMIGAHGGGHEGHYGGHEGRGSEQSEMYEHNSSAAPGSSTTATPAPSPARP